MQKNLYHLVFHQIISKQCNNMMDSNMLAPFQIWKLGRFISLAKRDSMFENFDRWRFDILKSIELIFLKLFIQIKKPPFVTVILTLDGLWVIGSLNLNVKKIFNDNELPRSNRLLIEIIFTQNYKIYRHVWYRPFHLVELSLTIYNLREWHVSEGVYHDKIIFNIFKDDYLRN